MRIRDEAIIRAEQELDELYKFQDRNILRHHDDNYNKYPSISGEDLLIRTIFSKRKRLCELYIDKMERYLGIKGESNDTKSK